ncbi:unnamed protein product, partial [marine sediment metagenome]
GSGADTHPDALEAEPPAAEQDEETEEEQKDKQGVSE